jgi:hypothetical protein
MNDLIMTAPNTPRVTPEKFEENLKTLVQMTLDCGAVPILLTSNPLNPDLFYSAQGQDKSWYSEVGTPLEWLDVYNNVTRKVASETGTYLIDMRASCDGVSYTTLLSDGIHLASKGNEIFKDTLVSWFKEHYESDPDAAPVSEADTYVYADKESSPVSVVSFKKAGWYTVTASDMIFKEMTGGIKICNTTGLWPEAHCMPENPVSIPVDSGYLYFDISTANVNTSIILFFDGATPSAYAEGQYIVINPYLGGNADSYTGDLLANQTLKGNAALSALGIPSGVIHDGRVLITGVKVFVAGTAYENVTIRQLAVGTGVGD